MRCILFGDDPTYHYKDGSSKRDDLAKLPPLARLRVIGKHTEAIARSYDDQVLRGWALLWDHVAVLRGVMVQAPLVGGAQFLESCGVLHDIKMPEQQIGESGGYTFAKVSPVSLFGFYRRLSRLQPGRWSIGTNYDTSVLTSRPNDSPQGLYISLVRLLPVPDREVPLADILEFRESRKCEVIALTHRIDEFYQDVLSAPDRPLAERKAVEKIAEAAADQLRVTRESGMRFRLADLSASLNVLPAVAAAVIAIPSVGLSGAMLAGLAGLAAGAKIEVKATAGMEGVKPDSVPFRYVASYHRELFSR